MAEKKQRENKTGKQFGLTTLSLKNRTTVMVITFLIVTMGISTYITLPKESSPEIHFEYVGIGFQI